MDEDPPDTPPEIVVDARGHRCPVPTLKLRRAMEAAPAGARLRLLADDPLARIDVPHFLREAGGELVEARRNERIAPFFGCKDCLTRMSDRVAARRRSDAPPG